MQIYPHIGPIILTESMYAEYGGVSGSATSAQLQNSFRIAEQRVTNYIGSFLLPTIVTGTFPYNNHQFIATDYGYVHRVMSASVLSLNNLQTCTLQTDSACAYIAEDTFGYLNISCVNTICGCGGWSQPYQYLLAYESGLPTGTANQSPIEHALVIIAEESLNEMLYPRMNEAIGARGIKQFSSLDYSEQRKDWPKTALGVSARAGYAADLIKHTIKLARPAITLR